MDWQNFKWFTLALWALGTQSFAVQGRSRLEREYAINKLLEVGGIRVPKILHVSLEKRLIFREYVEGEKMTEVIKRIFKAKRKSDVAEELQRVEEVGKKIAQVHKLDVSLGDAKPENIIISDNEILFLDLEQASKNGNQAWDIAEFLYYSGHYVSLAMDTKSVMWLTKAFVKGYLAAGGKRLNVEKAVSPLYTKVFSIFTLPHVILLISNMCKKLANERREI
jgi:tRNA A-37 threonylcarbamoyl transferase component Bud32